MARSLPAEQVTPADQLRTLLAEAESLAGQLGDPSPQVTERLLQVMDQVAALWPALEAAGADLRPESGRWQTIQATLRRQAVRAVRSLRPLGGLPALRARGVAPAEAGWWWYLDGEVRSAHRRQVQRTAAFAGIAVGVVLALILVVRTFFPQDPKAMAAVESVSQGQMIVQQGGDLQTALASFKKATTLQPSDMEAWLWLAATQQRLGQSQAAVASQARARALAPSELQYYLARAAVDVSFRPPEGAQADISAALKLDPQNPEAYYYQAVLYEAQGRYQEAIAGYEKAGQLAEARNEAQVTAVARYRMAMLMQILQAQGPGGTTPAP